LNDARSERLASASKTPPWHSLSLAEVFAATESSDRGLSSAEVADRLRRYGPNRPRPPKRRSAFVSFLLQFHNVLIYVLLASAAVTAAMQHWVDMAVILGVVIINALIGFLQEGKAERALDAIRNMLSLNASVLRDGHRQAIAAESLVPGDVVWVESGNKVPADVRLMEVKNLQVQEAALTGESVAVEKNTEPVEASAALGDRTCMIYAGTLVASGRGKGVVVATGDNTEIGQISAMLGEVRTLTTPLMRQIARFGRALTVLVLALAAFVFGFGVLVYAFSEQDMFLAAVGLAVAAIPEGLPAIVTITLAIGVQRMARRNALVRRLPAVETLGSVSVICTDKTGTLTRNEMMVESIATAGQFIQVSGEGYVPRGSFLRDGDEIDIKQVDSLRQMLRGAMLCSDAVLRQSGDEWLVDGEPDGGCAGCRRHQGRPRSGQREQGLPAHRRNPVRVRKPLHGDAAPRSRGARFYLRQGCARTDPADVRTAAWHGR
jgi:magnesium-transporting ATPase (P-type)